MTDARRAVERVLSGHWFWLDDLGDGDSPAHRLCKMLDQRADIDAVVFRTHGVLEFISWREQPAYEYDTLTIRYQTDRGNGSQWHKILRGTSLPSWYVHAYGVGAQVHGWMVERGALQDAVRRVEWRENTRKKYTVEGSGGQWFVALPAELLVDSIGVRFGNWPAPGAKAA